MNPPKATLDDLRIERKEPAGPKSGSGRWVVLFVVLVGIGVVIWWLNRPKPVELQTAVARELGGGGKVEHTVLNASGYVTARRAATVSSKVTGKVTEVLVEEGMKVKEGQVLARLDDTNIKASLRLAEAQRDAAMASLAETRARSKEADANLVRMRALAGQKVSAQAELDHAEAEAASLKARLEQQQTEITVTERQVASWQQQLDDTVIRAPFGGIVTSKNAQPGEMISPMSAGGGFTRTGICTIVDMESLEVEIDVNESYINRVQASQPVEAALDAYPEWKIPCKVIAIIPTADRQKSTVKVRVGFDKLDARILPEMSVKVAFRESGASGTVSNHGVAVPKSAVQRQDGHDVVLVVQNNRAERRAVTVGSIGPDETVIAAGLTAGEKIALDWPASLHDQSLVKEK